MLVCHGLETGDFLFLGEDFLDRIVENGRYCIVSICVCVCLVTDIHCSAGVECALDRIACVDLPVCCQMALSIYISSECVRYTPSS